MENLYIKMHKLVSVMVVNVESHEKEPVTCSNCLGHENSYIITDFQNINMKAQIGQNKTLQLTPMRSSTNKRQKQNNFTCLELLEKASVLHLNTH